MTDTPPPGPGAPLPPTPPAAPPRGGCPLWLRITLVLSLAANLLVAGIVFGAAGMRDRAPEGGFTARGEAVRDLAALPFLRALAPEDRRALARGFLAEAPNLRQNREALRGRFEALLAALRAEEFDRAAVTGLLAEQRGIAANRQEIGERLLIDRLEAMSPAERRAYSDRLEEMLRRGVRRP